MLEGLALKHEQAMQTINAYKTELAEKIRRGELEEKVETGSDSFTQTEWKKLIEKVDKDIETIQEEQKERLDNQKKEVIRKEIYEEMTESNPWRGSFMEQHLTESGSKIPYSFLEKDGVITYNGVTFVCDEKKQAICLGDMTNKEDVLIIPLEKGGSLRVNRENLGELGDAIGMFSPEDKKRILWAIASDQKVQQTHFEIEEDKNSLGDSADAEIFQ